MGVTKFENQNPDVLGLIQSNKLDCRCSIQLLEFENLCHIRTHELEIFKFFRCLKSIFLTYFELKNIFFRLISDV